MGLPLVKKFMTVYCMTRARRLIEISASSTLYAIILASVVSPLAQHS